MVRQAAIHAIALVIARLAATAVVMWLGFSALSDDDYARVTIAQTFAARPRLDPTGSSWLPMPFWWGGTWMMVLGRSLATAKAAATIASALSIVVLYFAARASRVGRGTALAASLAVTFMPLGAIVGAASVPEFPTAALAASALLLLRRPEAWVGVVAAMLVLPATLCRYEAWPVALLVALAPWLPRRDESKPADAESRPEKAQWRTLGLRAAASVVAVFGPAAWIAWNALAHGDPLHFHQRVTSFWFASGSDHGGVLSILTGYPWSLVAEAPELVILGLGGIWLVKSRHRLRTWTLPLAGVGLVLATLLLAEAGGGAPTHHPERALMIAWTVGWMVVLDLYAVIHDQTRSRRWIILVIVVGISFVSRTIMDLVPGYGVDRSEELQVGTWLRDRTPGSKALIDPHDYGYFAMIAASGAPERMELARSVDPRARERTSPFHRQELLQARIQETGARWLVVRREKAQVARKLGSLELSTGSWEVIRVH